jgi:hypothetical protein
MLSEVEMENPGGGLTPAGGLGIGLGHRHEDP